MQESGFNAIKSSGIGPSRDACGGGVVSG
ncbi:hypothetical protein SpCBS45565_g05366 [Spizellomyces sp. 'palustris']|nr:hypothetical protein SpCBS45565_g07604 [Spizellomyces sp. 'palustris']TPX65126.1 hypothetical protein SpCBS45565_g05366 [Spizellomyces sp. 'palustris']